MSSDGKPQPRSSSARHHFLAGLTTGVFSASLLQPADLLKTRLQQSHSTALVSTLRSILAEPNAARRLWRGTLPSVIRTGVGSALYFSSLNALRVRVAASSVNTNTSPRANHRDHDSTATSTSTLAASSSSKHPQSSSTLPTLSTSQNLLTGAFARAFAGLIMMPVTVLKVRYESSLYSYPSLLSASRDILCHEGPRGFFVGYGATAVRDAPYAGIYVVCYEWGKRWLGGLVSASGSSVSATTMTTTTTTSRSEARTEEGEDTTTTLLSSTKSIPVNFLSGALAAVTATTVTNPFDAVKTRLQLMPGRYGNMWRAGSLMVREDGVRSLFDGLGLRVGRKALSSALAWTGYEEVVRRVEGRIVG